MTTKEGQEFAEKHNMIFLETSAKNSTDEVFKQLAAEILRKIENQ